MAETDIRYSDLVKDPQQSAVITALETSDVFALAREDQTTPTDFDSKVGRAGVIARSMLNDFEFATDLPDFNDQSVFGALKELKGTWLSSTLSAGSTSLTFTSNAIKSDSIIEVYADNGNIFYTSIVVDGANHTCTVGFPSQSSAVVVDLWVR